MRVAVFLACVLVILLLVAVAIAQDAPPSSALPPLETCQAENLTLKEALVEAQARAIQAEAQLARVALADQKRAFETKARALLHPPDGSVWDWTRRTFTKPPPQP